MANVLIHRCTLRIVRRGGWSWGPDPARIARDAVRVLPELLAQKLSDLLPDGEDCEIAAPVRIRLSVRMKELSPGPATASPGEVERAAPSSASLEQKMERAVRAAFGPGPMPAADPPPVPRPHQALESSASPRASAGARAGGALARLLHAWSEQGVLERRLRALPVEQMEAWYDRLHCEAADVPPPEADAALAQRIEIFMVAHSLPLPPDSAECKMRRILLAAAAAAHLHLPLGHFALWKILDQVAPLEPRTALPPTALPFPESQGWPRQMARGASPGLAQLPPAAAADFQPPRISAAGPSAVWEIKVACALPFLLLGPLARMGYLDTLAAVLEAARMSADAPLFAAALAYKVLDPPQRGWRRSPESMQAAAALAGLRQPVPEASLVELARRLSHHTGALDLALTDALVAGHTPGEPVTLRSDSSGGYLLLDAQGCFPVAWISGAESLLPILERMGMPIVLISDDAAVGALLAEMDRHRVTFVIGLPPARGERWLRIQQGPGQLGWTNFAGSPAEPLRRAARQMESALAEARELSREFEAARPGVIRPASRELERSLTLAAAVASGMIAWKLWQGRGRTSPQQLLERYADLEGRVRFDASTVKVALPLGRRYQELNENGLLAPLEEVPWLDSRRLEFGGG